MKKHTLKASALNLLRLAKRRNAKNRDAGVTRFGHVDRVGEGVVTGWVKDADDDGPLTVDILMRGIPIATSLIAERHRQDVQDAGFGSGRYGFEAPIPPDQLVDFLGETIEVRRSSSGETLLHHVISASQNPQHTYRLEPAAQTANAGQIQTERSSGIAPSETISSTQNSLNNLVEAPKTVQTTNDAIRFMATGQLLGFIDRVTSTSIDGWLLASNPKTTPLLLVDGIPAAINEWPKPRPDVSSALGVRRRTGFAFNFIAPGGSEASLLAFNGNTLLDLARTNTGTDRTFTGIENVSEVLKDCVRPDAVAITCWDGAHNPIGRAKVLYDVIDGRRPVWLFCYLFDEFGGRLWEPLTNTKIRIIAIPWKEREKYHRVFRTCGVQFPTIWMCKPRLPTLMLASVLAGDDSRLILDFDDNEEHFSLSSGSVGKPYGGETIGLVRTIIENTTARTAASRSLAEDFGAEIVRHARRPAQTVSETLNSRADRPIRIGFVGTVRPHKNLLNAAQSIQVLNHLSDRSLEFHVHGDIRPNDYRKQLEENKAITYGTVHSENLESTLQTFDIVLTGYPSSTPGDEPITRYQITSKIGDALANGIPALVPYSRSVADLEHVPGVFLFTSDTFSAKLQEALAYSNEITLPFEFTPEGAFEAFQRAEAAAPKSSRPLKRIAPPQLNPAQKTVLLLWKQHDGALYGRRVDQIARAVKAARPELTVRVVEIMSDTSHTDYRERSADFMSDASKLLTLSDRKVHGGFVTSDDVIYDQVRVKTDSDANAAFFSYLWAKGMTPRSTIVVVFPAFALLTQLAPILRLFPLIADIVDNQLAWGNNRTRPDFIAQYAWLLRSARQVVFNSQENLNFFERADFLSDVAAKDVHVIPNWYMPPHGQDTSRKEQIPAKQNKVKIIYSGNLNDRIDWGLLDAIAGMSADIELNIVGDGSRASDRLRKLTLLPNVVYHGPLSELNVCDLLSEMHFAILPHAKDEISTFMNPLKVLMYSVHGLCTVAMSVPGLNVIDGLVSCGDPDTFLRTVRQFIDDANNGSLRIPRSEPGLPDFAKQYVNIVEATIDLLYDSDLEPPH